jgi:hypothetical protein
MEKNQASLDKIKTYLETSPDLGAYDYQEWDQQTEDFVNEAIRNTVPGGRIIEKVESNNRAAISSPPINKTPAPKPVAVETAVSSADLENDDLNLGDFDDELYNSL